MQKIKPGCVCYEPEARSTCGMPQRPGHFSKQHRGRWGRDQLADGLAAGAVTKYRIWPESVELSSENDTQSVIPLTFQHAICI